MGKGTLKIESEKIWFSTERVETFTTAYLFDYAETERELNEYLKHPWWYCGYNPYVTFSLPITYIKRTVTPVYRYTYQKIQLPKFRIQTAVPLRI